MEHLKASYQIVVRNTSAVGGAAKEPKMAVKTKETVSLAEAARAHGKCVETIYRLIRSGRIDAEKDEAGNWRIGRQALAEYYTGRAAGTAA